MITTELGRFPDELTASEAIMWKGDDQARLRSGGPLLLLLDRPPDWPQLIASFERFSRLFPRFRQRIVTTPFGLSKPRWVVDPDFDLSFHLRRVALPQPGRLDQLLSLIEHDASSSLDRLRPPWIGTVVEGLENGRAAFVLKVHHAVFDGRGMIQVYEHCFDRARESKPSSPVPAPPPQELSEMNLLRSAIQPRRLASHAARTSRGAISLARVALNPGQFVGKATGIVRTLRQIAGPSVKNGSPFLRARSASVRLGTIDVPLADLKAAAKAAGGSLNDALLAAVADGLGRYHQQFGHSITSVNLGFPISIRTADDDVGGNHFAGATISAPAGRADPTSRINRIRTQVLEARNLGGADVIGVLTTVMYGLPSWIVAALPIMDKIDAQVSNFPGLARRTYLAGAEIVATYGFGPHPGTPMMIVLLSHVDTCCVGVNVDAAAITDMPGFMASLRGALDDILALGTSAKP